MSLQKKYNIDADISQIGSNITLDLGVYHNDGNYLSFLTTQHLNLYGLQTKSVWYFFTTSGKLSKIGLIFDADELNSKVTYFSADFVGFYRKDDISKKSYWKGTKYDVYWQSLDDENKAVFISNPKIWPQWKE